MDIQKAMSIINSIKEIPYLKEDSIKNGDLSNVNSMSIMHYLLFPLLTTLGYEVFNQNEVKVVGLNDVEVYGEGKKALHIKILNSNDFIAEGDSGESLNLFTNGILYRVIGKGELIIEFDIREIEKENITLLFSLLTKDSLLINLSNSKFIDEKVIESRYGNLLESSYVLNSLNDLLTNPSDLLIDSIVEIFSVKYLETISKEKIKEILSTEIKEKGLSSVLKLVSEETIKDEILTEVEVEVVEAVEIAEVVETVESVEATESSESVKSLKSDFDPYLILDNLPGPEVPSEIETALPIEPIEPVVESVEEVETITTVESDKVSDSTNKILEEDDELSYLFKNN